MKKIIILIVVIIIILAIWFKASWECCEYEYISIFWIKIYSIEHWWPTCGINSKICEDINIFNYF